MTLEKLIERLETGSGDDRGIDAEIALLSRHPQAFFGGDFGTSYVDGPECFGGDAIWAGRGKSWTAPRYSGSLDAALAFAESMKAPIELIQWIPNGVIANTFHACGVGVDAARACLIATLKALEAKAHD